MNLHEPEKKTEIMLEEKKKAKRRKNREISKKRISEKPIGKEREIEEGNVKNEYYERRPREAQEYTTDAPINSSVSTYTFFPRRLFLKLCDEQGITRPTGGQWK